MGEGGVVGGRYCGSSQHRLLMTLNRKDRAQARTRLSSINLKLWPYSPRPAASHIQKVPQPHIIRGLRVVNTGAQWRAFHPQTIAAPWPMTLNIQIDRQELSSGHSSGSAQVGPSSLLAILSLGLSQAFYCPSKHRRLRFSLTHFS